MKKLTHNLFLPPVCYEIERKFSEWSAHVTYAVCKKQLFMIIHDK